MEIIGFSIYRSKYSSKLKLCQEYSRLLGARRAMPLHLNDDSSNHG
jgi:hypothetical protein